MSDGMGVLLHRWKSAAGACKVGQRSNGVTDELGCYIISGTRITGSFTNRTGFFAM